MKLKKELTLIDIFSVATGALISSGLFILPGLARGLTGPSVVISYLLAGLLASTGMLSIAEITTAMPLFWIWREKIPGGVFQNCLRKSFRAFGHGRGQDLQPSYGAGEAEQHRD